MIKLFLKSFIKKFGLALIVFLTVGGVGIDTNANISTMAITALGMISVIIVCGVMWVIWDD